MHCIRVGGKTPKVFVIAAGAHPVHPPKQASQRRKLDQKHHGRAPLFPPPHKHPRCAQHHQRRPAVRAKGLLGGVDQPHLPIAHAPQFLGEGLHIPVRPGLHVIIEGEYAALFQHPQGFPQQRPLVRTHHVVDIVDCPAIGVACELSVVSV